MGTENCACCGKDQVIFLDDDYLEQYNSTQAHVLDRFGINFANDDDCVHGLLLFKLLIASGNDRIIDKLSRILFPIGIDEDNIMSVFQSLVQIQTVEDMLIHNDLKMHVFLNILDMWTVTTFQHRQSYNATLNYILDDEYTKREYLRQQQTKSTVDSTNGRYITWVMNNETFREEYLLQRIQTIHQQLLQLRKRFSLSFSTQHSEHTIHTKLIK
eukprot:44813_1